MIIRALDSDGDMTFGKGKQNYLTGQDAIAENIKTRLLCFLNDCVWDMSTGIDWFTYLRRPGNQDRITLAVRNTLIKSYGVLRINSVSVNVSNRKLFIAYNINTIFTSNFAATLHNFEHLLLN